MNYRYRLLLLIPIILLFIFYLWASSSKYSVDQYQQINRYEQIIIHKLDTISAMTYNLGYLSGMTNNLPQERIEEDFKRNFDNAISVLKQSKINILAFQEIDFNANRSFYVNQYQQIAKKQHYPNAGMVVNWDKRYVPFPYWPIKSHFGELLSGQALMSNLEILSNDRLVLPKPESNSFLYNDFYLDRLAQLVWLKNGPDSLLIINVHFEAWDGPTREKQSKIVEKIYLKYEKQFPIILMGDFNCPPPYAKEPFFESTISSLLGIPSLKSSINREKYNSEPKNCFTYSSEVPTQRIDYIFYNSLFLNCIEAKVVKEAGTISDHLPVYSRFILRKSVLDTIFKG